MDDTTGYHTHSSISIAPLRIDKTKSRRAPRIEPRRSRNSCTHSLGDHSQSASHNTHQITPPPSPCSSSRSLPESDSEYSSQELHSFLRAFYPFRPAYSSSSSTVTLPLNAGDVILVHSVHTNGWADGTLLGSGARGWLPTNYCESYEAIHIRLLLRGCLSLFEQFRAGTVHQIAVTSIVAGVRNLLESTECLTRESETVRASDAIRRSRKVLLTDLSGLVKAAKRLDGCPNACVDELVDELILRTFKIVVRGVRFLDVWYDQYEIAESVVSFDANAEGDFSILPTPPIDSLSASRRTTADSSTECYFGSQKLGRDHLRFTPLVRKESYQSHPLPSTPHTQTPRDSVSALPSRQQSVASSAALPQHALARLNTTHDVLLSYLGSYIGRIHLQARFTPQLQLTQQQSVAAAKDLLAVVEVVYARDPRAKALAAAKEAMYLHISSLITAAREAISAGIDDDMDEDEDGILIRDGGKSLVEAATGCVRGAGECVAKSKFVIERIGDFELETGSLNIGLGISTDVPVETATEAADNTVEAVEDQPPLPLEKDWELLPPPPIPEKIPPPTPPKDYPVPAVLTVDTTTLPTAPTPIVAPPSPTQLVEPPEATSRRASTASSHSPPLLTISTSIAEVEYSADSIGQCLNKSIRADSISAESLAATDSTGVSSIRGSDFSILSQTSTRATTPEPASSTSENANILGSSQVSLTSGSSECECQSESHTEELTFNKEGQITGGTLPALVERLTVHDSTPDAVFVATFYLTFRLFTTPRDFAQALVDRFDAVAAASGATPVRLRVYNVFKGWLESHWRNNTDTDALEVISAFADTRLKEVLPAAAKRLQELAEKVADVDGPLVPRLVSGMGKTTSSSTTYSVPETPTPAPSITRSQLGALRVALTPGGVSVSILDFDPLEVARQITLKESRMFCSIGPEELIAQEWTKKKGSIATNVLAMSSLSTSLAHFVAETILDVHDTKKRAIVIKHWIKIADRCLELNNYDSLMAIMCTLNASTIVRLKKTWELVSHKTKQALENLRSVIDVSKNHAVLRARLRGHVPPCLPFLGTYLTDLTFVDVGNPSKRPMSIDGLTRQLINFDKHIKTARIISELQRFQIPYQIAEIPEMQTWIDMQMGRIHNSEAADVQHLYRRSLLLEPREKQIQRLNSDASTPPPPPPLPPALPKESSSGKSDLFAWAHVFKTPPN